MKYDIIEADSKDNLTKIINKNLEAGWTINGAMSSSDGKFYQVICHKSDGDPKPQTLSEDDLDKIQGVCAICGEPNCTNALHSDLEDFAKMMRAMKDIKK